METRNLARSAAVAAVVLNVAGAAFAAGTLEIGWAEADVTPPLTKRVPLDGQYYQRLADVKDPIHTRLKFVAVAFKKGGDYFLEGTIDNECVWGPWQDRVRARVHELVPEIAPEHIFINCIHTHCAPAIRHSGTPKGAQMEKDQPDVWGPNEYADFALERAAGAGTVASRCTQTDRRRCTATRRDPTSCACWRARTTVWRCFSRSTPPGSTRA